MNLNNVLKSVGGELRVKFMELVKWFEENCSDGVIVAFSGGVDSTFLTAVAKSVLGPDKVVAVTIDMPFIPRSEVEESRRIAGVLGVRHVVFEVELGDEEIWGNPPNRCYLCKKVLFGKIKEYARETGVRRVVDATNADDVKKYRPGIRALREMGVESPLAQLGISKRDIRELSRILGLPNWNKPSSPCLASRIPYGSRITVEKLRRVERAEELVKKITGARVVRVRDHDLIGRIEVGRDERKLFFAEEVMDRVYSELRKLGYKYVALDLRGYREGSMDEMLV